MSKQLAADGSPDEPLPITDPDDTGIPQQRGRSQPNTIKEQPMKTPATPEQPSDAELFASMRMWKARAMQNRAELREAQRHLEQMQGAHRAACAESKKYRIRARAAEDKLKELTND